MLELFLQFIQKQNLCLKQDKILLAVSGGMDSIVMLDLFDRAGYHYSIAHCNFKLRGDESEKDAAFVQTLGRSYQTETHIKSFETTQYAESNGLTIQEAARELRYNWFNELNQEFGYDRIAVAHHLDDQTETFFINLFRGSGVYGLKGIPVKRDKIIRPLMFSQRSDVEKYAERHNLVFREDTSNATDKYLRNRIRHYLIPEIENINSRYESALFNSLDYLAEDSRMLNLLLAEKRDQLIEASGHESSIPFEKLIQLKPLDTWIYYLLSPFGLNKSNCRQVALAIQSKETGKLFYSPSHQFLVDRAKLFFRPLENLTDISETLIHQSDNEIESPVRLSFYVHNHFDIKQMVRDKYHAYYDLSKLTFPLTVRRWKTGDRFRPFGIKGSQLVSDYLINQKTSRIEKDKTFVLISDGIIVWLIGNRVSDDCKVNSATIKVMEVHYKVEQ